MLDACNLSSPGGLWAANAAAPPCIRTLTRVKFGGNNRATSPTQREQAQDIRWQGQIPISTPRTLVLVVAVNEGAHPVVPQLDGAIVEARQHPRPLRVKGQALDAVALGLKLGQHRAGRHSRPGRREVPEKAATAAAAAGLR